MRKIRILLSFFILMLIISSNSFAANNDIINVSMNGSNVKVREVPIILNGQAVVLDDPSFIHIDRTLVPLRFLAESFGAVVGWEQKTKTAMVTLNGKKINLTIDSPNVTINEDKIILDGNSTPKLVTFANKDDAKTMVPIAFISGVFGYEVGYDAIKKQPFINSEQVKDEVIDEEVVELEPETDKDKDEEKEEIKDLNRISDIYLDYINGKEVIVVDGSKDAKYNITKINNPERLIIDIMDSSFIKGDYFEYNYDIAFIKGVRASQFVGGNNYKPEDKVVRVVLDAKDGEIDPNVKIEVVDGKLIIYPKKSIWGNINYDKTNSIISILTLDKTIYNVSYDHVLKTIEITIPAGFDNFDDDIGSVKDGIFEEVLILKNSVETKIKLKFNRTIEYEVLSDVIDNEIQIKFKSVNNLSASDRVIVLDPGHGGSQPGASSPNGIKEKDLNLKISLKVEAALKQLGYNVIMTRDSDTTVGLYERPGKANGIYADIFVSIHANSSTSPTPSGIEVLYSPATTGTNKKVDQYPLAKMVMDEILKATGAKERGVIKRPDLVVIREANMPAILVEVGFLSNAEEERQITNDSYQNKLVEGIIKGIEKYFEMY